MTYFKLFLLLSAFWCTGVMAAGGGGGALPPVAADGIIVVESVQEQSCLALRVDVPFGKALSGVRWFNGTDNLAFAKVLLGSGSGDFPPEYVDLLPVEEHVYGELNSWSEVTFTDPISSLSGTLFVVLQYPAFYVDPDCEPSLGVGFQDAMAEMVYYASQDGNHWVKLADSVELLLEPVYVDAEMNMVALSAPGAGGGEPASEELYENALVAAPNPFNPETTLSLTLEKQLQVEVKVFDVRGRVVRHLFSGLAGPGIRDIVFNGRDDAGRNLGSGVYWSRAVSHDFAFNQRLVLIK